MKQLLDSGTHFGHQTRRWNPKMKRFIFTDRNGIYIIDLQQTLTFIDKAYEFVKETVAHGGTVLFVGTKKQAQESVADEATRVGMPYVNQRWLGGMLTNFQTVHKRLQRLKELEAMEQTGGFEGRTKKEILMLTREKNKLERSLGGIRDMAKVPSAVWVVDTNKEHIAVGEARKLGIPVIAILDTNCDPDEVDYPIPGNDDAIRSAALLTKVIASAVAEGLQARAGAGPRRRQARGRSRRAAGRMGAGAAGFGDRPSAAGRTSGRGRSRINHRSILGKAEHWPNFTAADVKRLRELTGAGMLDCKNALADTDGDFDKAVEALRIKGAKDVGKRAERATAEGLVAAKDGALIELNSETDFVAKNAEFQTAGRTRSSAAAAASKAADVDALKAARFGASATRPSSRRSPSCRPRSARSSNCAGSRIFDGTVETYLHKRAADLPPAVGVLVEYTGFRRCRGRARGRAADRRAQGSLPVPRRCPRGRGGQRTPHRRGDRQGRGQARAGAAQDRRGPAQRLLQGRRAARAAVGVGQQEDRQGAARRGRRDRDPVRPLRGRPGLVAAAGMRRVHAFGDDALGHLDAVGLADAIRAGRVGRAEVVEAAIARTEAVNPALNGLAYEAFERARAAARPRRLAPASSAACRRSSRTTSTSPGCRRCSGTDAWPPFDRPKPTASSPGCIWPPG